MQCFPTDLRALSKGLLDVCGVVDCGQLLLCSLWKTYSRSCKGYLAGLIWSSGNIQENLHSSVNYVTD